MEFLKRHKTWVGAAAAVVLLVGTLHFANNPNCPLGCPFGSSLSINEAVAGGPGCSAKAAAGTCDAGSKASLTQADGKTCTKEDCIKAMMAKGMTKEEAEAAFASHCNSKGNAIQASASGCTASKSSAVQASASGCTAHQANLTLAGSTEKSCAADKEACISKCMAEKGITRAEAEACWAKCQADKAKQASVITTAVATEAIPYHSREACIDAAIARGLTKAEAEAAADKCEATGLHNAAAVQSIDAKSCGSNMHAAGAKSGCCASKAKAATAAANTATATPATPATTTASTGGSK